MADPPIRAFQRLSADITTSGSLVEADIAGLAALGVRHVINLAMPDSQDALADEAGLLAARAIGYTSIPVPFDAPTAAHYAAFLTAMAQAPRPLHVHCILNWRVSAFFYRYHTATLGMAPAEAHALMAQHWSPADSEKPVAQVWARFIAAPD